jgi:3-dehydroquinate dehydratase / shikimate dehydrogenase
MNNGKICVSVCAKTADDLIEKIKRAEEFADVIEIRFDCLDESEFAEFIRKDRRKEFSSLFLATFRATEQGGNKKLSLSQRKEFWLHSHIFEFTDWADFEEDISVQDLKNLWGEVVFKKYIKSTHDFDSVAQDLSQTYERIKAANSDVIKIAVQADDITDTIPIWKLLKRAKSENQQIIPIAMGEAGKWTRILGLAHGAFLTFASLDSETATAPGQVSAQDLHEVYRVKELDESTDVYGILGSNTSVSMSPYIHNFAFKYHNFNAVFVPLQVHDLDAFITKMVKPETREINLNFKGFSVTIPHKQSVIKHLDFIDETAEKIGAVNTVKIIGGKLHGFNTDARGFIEPLKQIYDDLKYAKVLILGAGGASKACQYALQKEGADVTIFGRSDISNFKFQNPNLGEFDIIVNATPIGMRGKAEGETPIAAEQMKGVKLVYDLVYIPQETELIKQAKSVGIKTLGGLEMLLAQAVEQQRIWTNSNAPIDEIRQIIEQRLLV